MHGDFKAILERPSAPMPEHWKYKAVIGDPAGIFRAILAKLICHQLGRRPGRNASKGPGTHPKSVKRLIQPRQRRNARRVSQRTHRAGDHDRIGDRYKAI